MSRCFPFPPPGYEKKATIDETDLLAKEKRKDKRHKKDKKDKEKREGKEKKDKDISKEKHGEKKERKEKHKDKDRDQEKNQITHEKTVEGQPQLHNGEKIGPNSLQDKEIKDSRYVLELSKRIKEDNKATGSQFIQKTAATVKRRAEVPGRAVDSSTGKQLEEREKVKDKNKDHRKVNGQRNHIDTRGVEKTFGQNFSGMGQEKVAGIGRLVEKDNEKQTEGKEKSKHNKSDNKDNKHKHRDQEKHRKSKDKEWDKEKKREEKAREITEPAKEHLRLKESSKDILDFRITKTPETLKLSSTSYHSEGNLGKRKEPEMNGYMPDNGPLPNKFRRPIPSSDQFTENGRKLEPCQTAFQSASEKQGPANNHRVDFKKRKINGLIAAPHLDACPEMPPPNIPAHENGETYQKPPHPDAKYLSQILSVPSLDPLFDSSDQEWLSGSNRLQTEKLDGSFPGVDGTQQVWAEALQIDFANILALPYVIPY